MDHPRLFRYHQDAFSRLRVTARVSIVDDAAHCSLYTTDTTLTLRHPSDPGDLERRLGLTTMLTPSSTCHQSGSRPRNMIGAGSPLAHCHHGCHRQWTANTDKTPAVACLKIIITDPGVLRNGWWFDAVLTRASNEGSWKFTITPFKCLLMVESAFKHFHIYLRICYATLMCSLTVTLIASILNTFMFRLNVNC